MARKPRTRASLTTEQLAAKKLQDQLYNIRKRYQRQAKKYEKQAKEAASGSIYQQQLMQAAKTALQEAEKYKFKNVVGQAKSLEEQAKKVAGKQLARTFEEAQERKSRAADIRKNKIAAKTLSGAEGKNFYAATRQLWEGVPRKVNEDGKEVLDIAAVNDAIMKGLGVSNMLDAIEKMAEATGYDFMSDNEQMAWQMYEQKTVVAKGERYIASTVSNVELA